MSTRYNSTEMKSVTTDTVPPDSSMMSMHYHQTEMGSRVKDIALLTVQHLSTLIKQKRDGLRPQIILLLQMNLSSGDRKLT